MPLDPDRVREASNKAQSLTRRFDAFLERRAINDAQDDDDDDEDELIDPAEEARKAATPSSALTNTEGDEPWWSK